MRVLSTPLWMRFVTAATLWAVPQSISSTVIMVDLSSRNLSSVPSNLPQTVEYLDLSRNHIRKLQQSDFRNTPNLRFLNVSWNLLEHVDPETFSGTPLLEVLDLSHNLLQNLLDQHYLLHVTQNLQHLSLAFNPFLNMTLGQEFGLLGKLRTLELGANRIGLRDFQNMTPVQPLTLTLYLESMTSYEEGSLTDVRAGRLRLSMSNRRQMDHGLMADALLLFDQVELTGLKGGYDHLTRLLSERTEIHTTHFYLTNISINWDDLTLCINVLLDSTISHLNVSDVNIFNPPNHDTAVRDTSRVRSLVVRNAVVMSFFFSQEAVYNFFINLPLENLSVLETSIIHMTCPQSHSPLLLLDFSHCALTDTIFSRVEGQTTLECHNLGNVTTLILRGNNLKNLQVLSRRLQHMDHLHHVDLSLNSLTYDSLLECRWPAKVAHIYLSSNGLTDSVFGCLPNTTEMLDLQNNQISAVPASMLLRLDSLSTLDLSNNRLRDLPPCHGFPALNTLLLRSNSLHTPNVSNLETCPQLKALDASHNPFTCTCSLRAFRSLGVGSEQRNDQTGLQLLSWPLAYHCSYPEAFRNHTLKEFWLPEVSCNVGLLAAAILCPAAALMVSVLVLCDRLDVPWYLGMMWRWTRAKRRARAQTVRPEDLAGIRFHAFVSYSQRDADWVKDHLLPNLEGPAGGLYVCHHENDFVAGKSIVENIMNCVEKSRRCVFVLSAHFVKSEWCHYELYFASHQRISADSLVLVLLEPIPHYLIPAKEGCGQFRNPSTSDTINERSKLIETYHQLKTMMSRHTYLEWPQEGAKHRLFWANLRAALQADLPHAPPTHLDQ